MTSKTANRFSPEVRVRAVRMVQDHEAEVDSGRKPGLTTDAAARLQALEREVPELRQANEILRKASAPIPRSCQSSVVLDALEQALHARRPVHRGGLVHHSDRGSQYVSLRYTERLAETINGLYTAELIHRRGPWRSFEAVTFAMLDEPAMPALLKRNSLRQTRRGLVRTTDDPCM